MRRLLLGILISLAALLIVVVVVVEIVLSTTLPRRLVLQTLEEKLGLRMTAQTLSTGWLGHTTLHNVTLSLPLADKPFAEVPEIEVRNTSLLMMLFKRSVTIYGLDLRQPRLKIRQEESGQWNLQDAIGLISRNTNRDKSDNAPPRIPRLDVRGAVLDVQDRVGRRIEVQPVDFTGYSDTPLSYKYDLSVAGRLTARGRVAPGDVWEHEAAIKASDVASWAQPWIKLPSDLAFDGRWHGKVEAGQLHGRIEVAQLLAKGSSLTGAADFWQNGAALQLRPDNLRLKTSFASVPEITVISGNVGYNAKIVRLESIQLSAYGGPATLLGWYDLGTRSGQAQVGWDKLELPGGIRHGGNLSFTVRRPFPDQIVGEGTLFSYGSTRKGPWRAQLSFGGDAAGNSGGNWHVQASELVWSRRHPITLSGLQLSGDVHRDENGLVIALASVHLPDDKQMSGKGAYHVAERSWSLALQGERWPLHPIEGEDLAYEAIARGDSTLLELRKFVLSHPGGKLWADGSYRFGIPKPVVISASIDNQTESAAGSREPILLGSVRGDVKLEGTLLPLQLGLTGMLNGRALRIAGRPVGNVALRLGGDVDEDAVTISTERLLALGGEWYFGGLYGFGDNVLDTDIRVGKLPLQGLADVAHGADVGGTLDGEWHAYLPGLRLDPSRLKVTGWGMVSGFRARKLAADAVKFTTTMADGDLRVSPIEMKRGAGTGKASASWHAPRPHRIEVEGVELRDWPIDAAPIALTASLTVPEAKLDLPQGATLAQLVAPDFDVRGTIGLHQQTLTDFTLHGNIDGRVATIDRLTGAPLGGQIDGGLRYDVDRPLEASGTLNFSNLQSGQMVKLVPELAGLAGAAHGSARLSPAKSLRPLEPLALNLQALWDGGNFRGASIKTINLNLFLNRDRLMLDDRPGHDSTVDLADGTARIWGRVTRRADGVLSSQTQIRLDGLKMEQLTRAADPTRAPTPGLLSGSMMFLYDTRPRADGQRNAPPPAAPGNSHPLSPAVRQVLSELYGEANLHIDQANIGTLPVFSTLYDVMSLGASARGPTGHGVVDAHLEQGVFTIRRLRYFNRGLEVRGQFASPAIWDFPNNPVNGVAVGTLQPLAAVKLPLFADLSGALSALQGDLTTVEVKSPNWTTLDRNTRLIPFAAAGRDIQSFIFGDISGDTAAGE